MRFLLALALVAAASGAVAADSPAAPTPAPSPTYPTANYVALMANDTLINSDIWDPEPKIFTANYAFEGIQGVIDGDKEEFAKAAGGAWNIVPESCGSNLPSSIYTNVRTPDNVANTFGWPVYYADAMPVVFSWPVLTSTVHNTDFEITLNNGTIVNPDVASIVPNLELNERHVIVVFGHFGNRLPPSDPNAVYVTQVKIVDDGTPLTLYGPNGKFNAVGLTYDASNSLPYGPNAVGPKLVAAKLSPFSTLGEATAQNNPSNRPNHCAAIYGDTVSWRLRMYTSGGFTPDGVFGLTPNLYNSYFRVHVQLPDGNTLTLDDAGTAYNVGNLGTLTVLGLAELGLKSDNGACPYLEDKDNYIDICIQGDEAAARRIIAVEMPHANSTADPTGRYKGLYNPGGPGNNPTPGVVYTVSTKYQLQPVTMAIDNPLTVTYIPPVSASPAPSPVPVPASPVPSPAPACSSYVGIYRIQSAACTNRYVAFAVNCSDTVVRFFTLKQAGAIRYRRTYWKINSAPNVFTNVRADRDCDKTILASNITPSFGSGTVTWQYKLIPAGSCTTVNMQAKSGQGAGLFLGVKSDCTGYEWKTLSDSLSAKWNLIKI